MEEHLSNVEQDTERRQATLRRTDVFRRYHAYRASWFNFLHSSMSVFLMMGSIGAIALLSGEGSVSKAAAQCVMFGLFFVSTLIVAIQPKQKECSHIDLRVMYQRICTQLRAYPMRELTPTEWTQIEKDLYDIRYKNDETYLYTLLARAENDFCDANRYVHQYQLRWWHRLTIQTNLFGNTMPTTIHLKVF